MDTMKSKWRVVAGLCLVFLIILGLFVVGFYWLFFVEYVRFVDPQVQEGGQIISFAVEERVLGGGKGNVPWEVWIDGRRWSCSVFPPGSYWATGKLGEEPVDYWAVWGQSVSLEPDIVNVEFSNVITTSFRIRIANTSVKYPINVELREGDKILDKFTLNYGPNVNPYPQCPADGKITDVKLKRYRGYAIGENGSEYSVVLFANTYGRGFRNLEGYLDTRYSLISPANPPDNPCDWANLTYPMNYFGTLPFTFNLTLKTQTGRLIDSVVVGAKTEEEIEPLN
ncbi:Uncharacterised protein [uncultured archaeon]|nr:Uncharacterised protein [uncultured archaeon]